MEKYVGRSVYAGISIGTIRILKKEVCQEKKRCISDVEAERKRFEEAEQKAVLQLKKLYSKAVNEVGEKEAAIFEMQQMILEDLDYRDSICNIIEKQKGNAEYAVTVTRDKYVSVFAGMDDEYMRERSADVCDVSERLIRNLNNYHSEKMVFKESTVIVADDLTPSETVQLDKTNVVAFVTAHGSMNSHAAILARTMSIPAIVDIQIHLDDKWDGMPAVVNGYSGEFVIQPSEEILQNAAAQSEAEKKGIKILKKLKGKESITKDGIKIKIYANVGGLSDLESALANDTEGIGLFRSEFLYLQNNNFPTEEEQFDIYRCAVEMMNGKKTIIRTLDIGADKKVDYFQLDAEENPAMGYRAIRICLERKEIFITQLRALFRASAFGNLGIMFPMIISTEEIDCILNITEQVKAELIEQKIRIGKVELGIMIETPAAVMISGELAAKVDFFSIGTNDLTQYTLAIDRQNPKLDKFYNPHHLAILRMIELVVKNAHKKGIWVGICGELGADLELTEQFLKMGIDELSVVPSFILKIREKVRSLSIKE